MDEYRLLIPAKGNSRRAPGKNVELLPFTLDYVDQLGLMSRCWVMTECEHLANMAQQRGAQILWEEQVGNDFGSNFTRSYVKAGWEDQQVVVLLEPTKPFRQKWLVEACLAAHKLTGKAVTTGLNEPVTFIEWDGCEAIRRAGIKVLDGCVIIAKCLDFRNAVNMGDFWARQSFDVVWHEAPTGIDFDWPVDMETHLPTVQRLIRHGIYGF